jgi:hypothetical protein
MTGQSQPATRGTSNSNARGNSRDRAARRRWLVTAWRANVDLCVDPNVNSTVFLGGGVPVCRCYRCGTLLTEQTVTVDRIVPGCKGGRYVRGNIRPACAGCNSETGGGLRGT